MVDPFNASSRWRLLEKSFGSVFQNLALEEALVRTKMNATTIPTLRLWVNPRSVVLGRFQDVAAETDVDFCGQNGIQIARRFTGGGAVFEDEGTLNVTIVTPRRNSTNLLDLHRSHLSLLVALLNDMGLGAEFRPPNSILVSGKKVAGAAAGISQGFNLWHASILVSTNLEMLTRALAPSQRAIETRRIRSKWVPVTTIERELGKRTDLSTAKLLLASRLKESTSGSIQVGDMSSEEMESFDRLYTDKYAKPEWNIYGYDGYALKKKNSAHTTMAV